MCTSASHFEAVNAPSNKQTTQIPDGYNVSTINYDGQNDRWLSGFFDWGTWQESLASWAAGVVVGRARLGGIPCGVITAETRSVVCRVPADPANLSSEAQIVKQAGQVWYPDSAYKTAQAIADMSKEQLPLFIFANWRGFSGGMKDMYDQVSMQIFIDFSPSTAIIITVLIKMIKIIFFHIFDFLTLLPMDILYYLMIVVRNSIN